MRQVKQVKVAGPYELIWQEFKQLMEYTVVSPICQGTMPEMRRMQDMFTRFGNWETFCQEMDIMMSEESYYQRQYEDIEAEKDELEDSIRDIESDIQDVISDLENIPDSEDEALNETITSCIKALDSITMGEKVKKAKKDKR